jgi:3-oxoacyl-[acyl-carrier-protein] synthase II
MSEPTCQAVPPASVLGVGAVTPIGRTLESIAVALAERAAQSQSPLLVADELLSDATTARRMRRAGRWASLAATAATDAWTGAQHAFHDDGDVGVIVATGFGPHVRTFRFLDGILDCGDASALPTDFSHSVHNVAAAYITELLGLRGRSCTLADFEAGFHQAVLLGQCWLAEGACSRVLLGAVDELGEVLLHLAGRMTDPADRVLPGEGAVFVTLGKGGISGTAQIDALSIPTHSDLLVVDEPPMHHHGAPPTIDGGTPATFTPYFGHSASSLALQTLGALLAVSKRFTPANVGRPIDSAIVRRRLWNGRHVELALAARPSC